MNGKWTRERSYAHEPIGTFCRPMAKEFFERMEELGVPKITVAVMPKDLRKQFYAGEVVILTWDKLGNSLIMLTKEHIEKQIEIGKAGKAQNKSKIIPYTDTPPPFETK